MSDGLQWSRLSDTSIADSEMTAVREAALAMLPADMPTLEEKLGVAAAHAFCQWGGRTKRLKWSQADLAYIRLEGRRG